MHRLLSKIARGDGYPADLELLQQLCPMVRETSLCGLGQTAPNPVLSTLRYFGHEYKALLKPAPAHAGGRLALPLRLA
jgi:bidirectional [NiFe] hydrogenase diaphorase subunit